MNTRLVPALVLLSAALQPVHTLAVEDTKKLARYPTEVMVDYVIGCMAANGQTQEMLQKCSCSMDFIASAIPFEQYQQVETLLRLRQMPGVGRNAVYRNSAWSEKAIARLREVQAESTLRCF